MADTGNSATIVFGTSGFSADYEMIGGIEATRPSIPTSHLGTQTNETFMPGDLVDNGEIECEFQFNPNTQPPISGAAETVTVTFPVPSGLSNGATAAFSAFVRRWKSADLQNNEKMMASVTLKVSGAVTWTDAT